MRELGLEQGRQKGEEILLSGSLLIDTAEVARSAPV